MMLSQESFQTFFLRLEGEMETLERQLHTIPLQSVLYQMGFPPNWKEIQAL